MLTVHHLDNSRSQRILWLLEELGVEYEIERYGRDRKTMLAPKSLREIHPLGKSPVVTYGDVVLAESGAIIEHLVDEYDEGKLRPATGTPEYRRYRYWLHYAEGSAMPPLLLKLVFTKMPEGAPLLARPLVAAVSSAVQKAYVDKQVRLHVDYWESELGEAKWFAGDDFTAADIQMSFPLEAAANRLEPSETPNIQSFVERIRERAGYQRAIERGGPYSL